MEPVPKVSVAMIVFNHEPFIVQAVESALMQETDFSFEIVIGEDCSTDRSRNLLQELAAKHPDRIRLLLNSRNLGMHANFVQVLSACRGRYIAILEGDDYWTDPRKLQRQADLLDGDLSLVICHHKAIKITEDGSVPPIPWPPVRPRRRATLSDLLGGCFIVTCTAMFRNGLIREIPPWFYRVRLGDWALHILNAQHGRIGYIDRVMAVYRVHSGGIWSTLTPMRALEGGIETAEVIRPALPAWQQQRLARTVLRWRADITAMLYAEGREADARQYAAAHLPPASARRLRHFYRGLDEEREGRRLAATAHLLGAACHWRPHSRIGALDIILALSRVNFPATYRKVRDGWRRWRLRGRRAIIR